MNSEILQKRLNRYVSGKAWPAEKRQIQTWLSCTTTTMEISEKEKEMTGVEILHEVQAYTAYPLFYPKKEKPWWQKITAMF